MIKKLVIAGICFVTIWVFFMVNYENTILSLDKNDIQQISISTHPPLFDPFDMTDREQITTIADYFASLHPVKTRSDINDYVGMTYNVKIIFKDNTTRQLILLGNRLAAEDSILTYRIADDQATQFDIIVANILLNNQNQTGAPSITGTVVSLKTEESGRDISCVIKDKEKKGFDIYVNDARIIDTTGTGWMILHQHDLIKVFFTGSADARPIAATTVYIQNAAQSLAGNN